jgi:hypothetical protein
VFHRIGHALLIVALLAATGGHWALLQTVAWTNMLAENLQTCSVSAAVTKTFDGNHPCRLCKQIAAGKKSEKKAEFPTFAKKIEFTHAASRFVFAAPMNFWLQNQASFNSDPLTHAPPLPPPRSLLG